MLMVQAGKDFTNNVSLDKSGLWSLRTHNIPVHTEAKTEKVQEYVRAVEAGYHRQHPNGTGHNWLILRHVWALYGAFLTWPRGLACLALSHPSFASKISKESVPQQQPCRWGTAGSNHKHVLHDKHGNLYTGIDCNNNWCNQRSCNELLAGVACHILEAQSTFAPWGHLDDLPDLDIPFSWLFQGLLWTGQVGRNCSWRDLRKCKKSEWLKSSSRHPVFLK